MVVEIMNKGIGKGNCSKKIAGQEQNMILFYQSEMM